MVLCSTSRGREPSQDLTILYIFVVLFLPLQILRFLFPVSRVGVNVINYCLIAALGFFHMQNLGLVCDQLSMQSQVFQKPLKPRVKVFPDRTE